MKIVSHLHIHNVSAFTIGNTHRNLEGRGKAEVIVKLFPCPNESLEAVIEFPDEGSVIVFLLYYKMYDLAYIFINKLKYKTFLLSFNKALL